MTPVRVGATICGLAVLCALLFGTRFPWHDGFAWFFVALISLAGAAWGASVVRTVQKFRQAPRALLAPVALLVALSGIPSTIYYRQSVDARDFLAHADSVRAEVVQTFLRSGTRLVASFTVHGQSYRVMSPSGVDSLASFAVGDSIWLYYPPAFPDSAHFGHPSADGEAMTSRLLWLWIAGGPLLCGYGQTVAHFLRPSTYAVPRSTA